jgi:hypothetical protein
MKQPVPVNSACLHAYFNFTAYLPTSLKQQIEDPGNNVKTSW